MKKFEITYQSEETGQTEYEIVYAYSELGAIQKFQSECQGDYDVVEELTQKEAAE